MISEKSAIKESLDNIKFEQVKRDEKPTEQKRELKEKFLNIKFDLSKISVNNREKQLEKIISKFRLWVEKSITHDIKNVNEFGISYLISNGQKNRTFAPFTLNQIRISANISNEYEYERTILHQKSLTTTKDGKNNVLYTNENDLIKDLNSFSKGVVYEREDLMQFAKILLNHRELFEQIESAGCNVWNIDFNNLIPNILGHKEIECILSAFEQFYDKLETVFNLDENSTNILILQNLPVQMYSTFDFQKEILSRLIYVKGTIITKQIKYQEAESRPIIFLKSLALNMKIELRMNRNQRYYTSLTEKLWIGSTIVALGILGYDNTSTKDSHFYLNVLCIQESGEKPRIQAQFQLKNGSLYYYENDFQRDCPGLYIRSYDETTEKMTSFNRFTRYPCELLQLYQTEEDEQLFHIKIHQEYFGSIDTIVNNLKLNTRITVDSSDTIRDCLANVLDKMIIQQQLIAKRAFTVTGIQLDEKQNLLLVIPQLQKLVPNNDKAKEAVQSLEHTNFFFEDAPDENEIRKEVTQCYFNLANYRGQTENLKIVVLGFSLISNFFRALSRDQNLDVFPLCGLVGIGGSGKTQYTKLFTETLNGIEMQNGSDIQNDSRLRDVLGRTAFTSLVDEIQKMHPAVVNNLKTALTNFKNFGYKDKNQKWIKVPVYGCFFFTSNSMSWLDGDDALRDGRVILVRTIKKIEDQDLQNQFDQIKNSLLKNKRLGMYLFQFILKFIRIYRDFVSMQHDVKSDLDALLYLIEQNRKYIRILTTENSIRFTDPRKLTIYALLLTGLQFWQEFFKSELGIPNEFLSDLLSINSTKFAMFIKESEDQLWETRKEGILQIRTFISFYYKDQEKVDLNNRELYLDRNTFYLTNTFLARYNEWASKSNFPTYKSLNDVADVINKVANPPVLQRIGTFKVKDPNTFEEFKKQDRVVDFDVFKLLGEKLVPDEPPKILNTNNTFNPMALTNKAQLELKRKEMMEEILKKCLDFKEGFSKLDIQEGLITVANISDEFLDTCFQSWEKDGLMYRINEKTFKLTQKYSRSK